MNNLLRCVVDIILMVYYFFQIFTMARLRLMTLMDQVISRISQDCFTKLLDKIGPEFVTQARK